MEKQQFDQLEKLLNEVDKHLKNIDSRLERMDKSLDVIKDEVKKKKRRSQFDI